AQEVERQPRIVCKSLPHNGDGVHLGPGLRPPDRLRKLGIDGCLGAAARVLPLAAGEPLVPGLLGDPRVAAGRAEEISGQERAEDFFLALRRQLAFAATSSHGTSTPPSPARPTCRFAVARA